MFNLLRTTSASMAIMLALTACAGAGGLGDILGGVLGQQGGQNQVAGTIVGVDTRAQQIGVQLSNGQQVALGYDNQTKVVYQDQYYNVTALERGDQVTARVQSSGNAYYTDLVQVDRSVSSTGGTVSRDLVALEGTVRQVDRTNGWFLVENRNGGTVTVSMPYNVSRADDDRFQRLRVGNVVRTYVVPISSTRAEFRQFY
jgi:hypothetical protein